MYAQTNQPYPNRIQLVLEPFEGPFTQAGPLGAFDPRRDVEVYVDGVLQTVQTFSFDPANNRYLLFMTTAINLQGVIQIIHHVPSPPFVSSTGGVGMSYVLTTNVNPTYYTTTVTLTVTITSNAGTPTGTVQFYDGATPIGSPQTLVGGVASYTDPSFGPGTHPLFAVYTASGLPFVSGISNIVSEEIIVFQTMTHLVVT